MADDRPDPYRLAGGRPPKRRYRPMPGAEASDKPAPEEPAWKRFLGHDPFPWALGLCVLIWVGLGLGSRSYPPVAYVLMVAGFVVCILGEIWFYVSIIEEDRASGVFAFFSNGYRLIYLHMQPGDRLPADDAGRRRCADGLHGNGINAHGEAVTRPLDPTSFVR